MTNEYVAETTESIAELINLSQQVGGVVYVMLDDDEYKLTIEKRI